MDFKETKEYLINHYSKEGFTQRVIDKDEKLMLKNANISNAYIMLTNKKNNMVLELYNVKATFPKNDLDNISIIENIDNKKNILLNLNNSENKNETKVENKEKKEYNHTIKNFILNFGQKILNITVVLSIVVGIILGINKMSGLYGSFGQGIITMIIVFLTVILSSFTIYLLIDIRDKLVENNELLKKATN